MALQTCAPHTSLRDLPITSVRGIEIINQELVVITSDKTSQASHTSCIAFDTREARLLILDHLNRASTETLSAYKDMLFKSKLTTPFIIIAIWATSLSRSPPKSLAAAMLRQEWLTMLGHITEYSSSHSTSVPLSPCTRIRLGTLNLVLRLVRKSSELIWQLSLVRGLLL